MGRRFEADLDASDDLRLPIDRSLLYRAFENVISNALHFTPEGGLVRLSAHSREGALHIDVDDEGPGIPASERERVFEPFYRGFLASAKRMAASTASYAA